MPDLVSYEQDGEIGIITLDSPPMNQMSLALFEELDAAFQTVREDETTVVILRSALDGVFSAGADLNHVLETVSADAEEFVEEMEFYQSVFDSMKDIPVVFIAEINGHCLAGGFELALGSDLRYMARGSHEFGAIEIEIGAIPAVGTQRLLREVGRSTAFDLIVNGKRLSPEEAADLGLVQEVYAAEELSDRVMEQAEELAAGPTKAIRAAKKGIKLGTETSYEHALEYQHELLYDLLRSHDFEEGVRAFTEKRPADFRGE